MPRELIAIHTRDRRSQDPAVFVDALLRTGISYWTPAQLRALARQLNTIANDADQGAAGAIQYRIQE